MFESEIESFKFNMNDSRLYLLDAFVKDEVEKGALCLKNENLSTFDACDLNENATFWAI